MTNHPSCTTTFSEAPFVFPCKWTSYHRFPPLLRPLLLHFYGGLETWVPQYWPWQDQVPPPPPHDLEIRSMSPKPAHTTWIQAITPQSLQVTNSHNLLHFLQPVLFRFTNFAQSIPSHFHSFLASSILAQPLLSEKKKILQGMFLKHVNDLLSWK